MKTELDLSTPISEVIRSEDEYREIFRNRMERLEKLSSVGGARTRVQECIELTRACDACANRLKDQIVKLVADLAPENWKARFLEKMEKDYVACLNDPPVDEAMFSALHLNFTKAKNFLLSEVLADDVSEKAETILQAFDRVFANEDWIDRMEIRHVVELGILDLESFTGKLRLLSAQFELIKIYRGILYSFIMKKEGGELAMKAFREKTKETFSQGGAMAADLVPFAGFARALFELLSTWKEDRELKYLENWAAVSRYFEIYPELLRRWLDAANGLHSICDPSVERAEPQPL